MSVGVPLPQPAPQAAPAAPLETRNAVQYFAIFRDYVKHEDGLIHNRLSWNFTIQSFLFATYGYCLQKLIDASQNMFATLRGSNGAGDWSQVHRNLSLLTGYTELRDLAYVVIPIVGCSVALSSSVAAHAANRSINTLDRTWNTQFLGVDQDLPPLTGGGAKLGRFQSGVGMCSSYLPPWLFALVWVLLGVGGILGILRAP